MGFKSVTGAQTTLAGIDLAHRIHKGQFAFGSPHDGASLKQLWDRALADADAPREDSRGGLLESADKIIKFGRGSSNHSIAPS